MRNDIYIYNYRFTFNGKESDDETGLQDYGYRIYNPALGRFLSVDPLNKKYPELTPYQFASDQPIWAVDLDGLEKLVVILEEHPEKMEFDPNANSLENDGYDVLRVKTGAELIQVIEEYTKSLNGGEITNIVILSHGSNDGLYGLNGADNGFYTDQELQSMGEDNATTANNPTPSPQDITNESNKLKQNGAATTSDFKTAIDNGSIKLAKDATIVFGGCNTGETKEGIAGELTQKTGITTIGADGFTWDGGANRKQPGDINNSQCTTRGSREADHGWNKYSKDAKGNVIQEKLSSGGTGVDERDLSKSNGRSQKLNVSNKTLQTKP